MYYSTNFRCCRPTFNPSVFFPALPPKLLHFQDVCHGHRRYPPFHARQLDLERQQSGLTRCSHQWCFNEVTNQRFRYLKWMQDCMQLYWSTPDEWNFWRFPVHHNLVKKKQGCFVHCFSLGCLLWMYLQQHCLNHQLKYDTLPKPNSSHPKNGDCLFWDGLLFRRLCQQ